VSNFLFATLDAGGNLPPAVGNAMGLPRGCCGWLASITGLSPGK
jgi:hypothetical protein